jgi:hypothetical protein
MPGSVRERDDTDVDCRMLTKRVDRGWPGPVRDCVPRRAGVALEEPSTARATQAGLPPPAITWEAAASCRVPSLSAGRYPSVHRTGHSLYSRPPPGALPVSTVTGTRLPQDRRACQSHQQLGAQTCSGSTSPGPASRPPRGERSAGARTLTSAMSALIRDDRTRSGPHRDGQMTGLALPGAIPPSAWSRCPGPGTQW